MGAKTKTAPTARGETLLREWGIAGDPDSLSAAWGRDPEADLAIITRLGTIAEPASAAALVALEHQVSDKLLRKEIRRALFRLEQRGVAVPSAPAEPQPAFRLGTDPTEGYMSAVDGNGDQFVWIVRPRAGGVLHLFAVLNDFEGLSSLESHPVSRKDLRAMQNELRQKHEIELIPVDAAYCDFRILRGQALRSSRGGRSDGDYLVARAAIFHEPPPTEVRHPVLAFYDLNDIRGDADALAASHEVLEEKELRTWFLPPERLRATIERINEVMGSPLVLNEYQQRDRVEEIVEETVSAEFGGERQAGMVRRLYDMAYIFHTTRRPEAARRSLAAALALEAGPDGGRGVPLCEALVRISLTAHLEASKTQQQEESRGNLIVTPQQARATATRRRS